MKGVTYYLNKLTGKSEPQEGSGGAALVSIGGGGIYLLGQGPDTLAQAIPFGNVSVWERYEFPVGSNITFLTVHPKVQATIPFSGTAANVNDNTIVYQSPDVSLYQRHEFSVITAPGAGSIEVLVSHDGTNYETVAVQVTDRLLVEGAAVQSLAQLTVIGNYILEGHFKLFRIQNNGATTGAAASVRGAHTDIRGKASALVYLDADSTASRDAICGTSGQLPEGVPVANAYECPMGEITAIPLRAALSKGTYAGGVVDVRSLEGPPLNITVTAG